MFYTRSHKTPNIQYVVKSFMEDVWNVLTSQDIQAIKMALFLRP